MILIDPIIVQSQSSSTFFSIISSVNMLIMNNSVLNVNT
jgi:hypothetical protein